MIDSQSSAPNPAIQDPVVEFRGAGLTLPTGKTLVADLNFAVRRGETLVLLGRSGSGKTTTLKLVNRLLETTSGAVFVEGKPAADWDPFRLRRHIGYVIQETGLFPHFTVERNIALVPRLEGWLEERTRERVREMLTLVGLPADAFSARYPRELSGGQRQRVGVARALAADPPIILMDEPFGALDPITRRQLQREFRRIQARVEKCVILVTHDMAEALALGDRIGVMEGGRLIWVGTPQQIVESDDARVRALLESVLPLPRSGSA